MIRVLVVFLMLCAAAAAQVMTPNIVPPGGLGQMVPNQGENTPNPIVQQQTVVPCQGTGYNFTLACNSQYIVAL